MKDHPDVRLDTSLVMTDAGRSGFKRKDWDTYALARFVECMKSGRVEAGSYLLVENLDRLSRESAGEATELFLSIVNKGTVIVQLSPVVIEFRRPVDMYKLMFAVMELSRGHSESAIKSERGRASWARKHREAEHRLVTRRLPGWIKYENGKLVLDKQGAATVRKAFALARDGYGTTAIAKRFNLESVPVLGKKLIAARGQSELPPEKREMRPVFWTGSLVWHILTSSAAIGEYIPYRKRGSKSSAQPVPNYYPPVIDADTFYAVRGAIASRGKIGRGRQGNHVNLFAGLLRDTRDGGTLTYWHTGKHPPTIIPVNAKEGKGIKWVSFPAYPFEEAVLSKLTEINPEEVRSDGKARRDVEVVTGRLAEIDHLIRLWTAKMDNPAIVDTVAEKLAALNQERKRLTAERSDAQRKAASPAAESWCEFQSLADLLKKDNSKELRMQVRSALRRSIETVTCLFVPRGRTRLAAVRIDFVGGAGHRDYLIVYKMGYRNGRIDRPGSWWVRSFADAGLKAGGFDLRQKGDAVALEKALARIPLTTDEPTARKRSGGKPATAPAAASGRRKQPGPTDRECGRRR